MLKEFRSLSLLILCACLGPKGWSRKHWSHIAMKLNTSDRPRPGTPRTMVLDTQAKPRSDLPDFLSQDPLALTSSSPWTILTDPQIPGEASFLTLRPLWPLAPALADM